MTPASVEVTRADQAALGKVKAVSSADVDQFVRMRNVLLSVHNGTTSPSGRVRGGPPVDQRGKVTLPEDAQQQLAATFQSLSSLFGKGLVTEADVSQLRGARGRIDDLLALKDDADLLQLLPGDLVDRLQTNLFGPLEQLKAAADGQTSSVLFSVARRDEAALKEKLSSIGDFQGADQFRTVNPTALGGASAAAVDRFAPGDLMVVGRKGGTTSMGVVTGKDPDGFRVEVLSAGRDGVERLGLKKVAFEEAAQRNPLKLGDHAKLPEGEVWVNQIGADGRAAGVMRTNAGKVRSLDADALERIAAQLSSASAAAAATVQQAAVVSRPSSRQSLEGMLDDIWSQRAALAGQGDGTIYNMYNAVTEPNPRSITPEAFLGGLAEAATGRPAGAVSNTQSGHGAIDDAVDAYRTGGLGDRAKASLERTFFRFQRANWQPWAITERLYINAQADHAPDVMKHIVGAIIDRPEAFPGVEMAKVSGPAAVSGRAENIVVYTTGPEATARLQAEMQRYQRAHPEHFKTSVPKMTQPVGDGMAIGAEPVKHGGQKSFGGLRAEVIAAALDKAVSKGLDRQGFGELVDSLMRAEDIDPAQPHKNLESGR